MTASVHDITRERIRRMATLNIQATTPSRRNRGPSKLARVSRILGSAFAGAVLLFFVLMVVGR